MTVPEPCSEERLEELLKAAADPRNVTLYDGTYEIVDPGISPAELAWLVSEARDARSLRRDVDSQREVVERISEERDRWWRRACDYKKRLVSGD